MKEGTEEPRVQIAFELPETVRRRFKIVLVQHGRTQQGFLEEFVTKYVERAEKEARGE